jgi:hypothetical protein
VTVEIGYIMATELTILQEPFINSKSRKPFRLRLLRQVGATGLEPVTPSVSYSGDALENAGKQGVSATPADGLHSGLHTKSESTPSAAVQALAALLANLSETDRAALALLLGK